MEKKSKGNLLTIILVIIIIILLGYIFINGKVSHSKDSIANNKAIKIVESVIVNENEGEETLILKVENRTSNNFTNVAPYVVFYDSNDMPMHFGWGSQISFFNAGETRFIKIYDGTTEYKRAEIGLVKVDEEDKNIVDLRDKISYEVEKSTEPEEEGQLKLIIKGENKYDKEVDVKFQVAYYSGNKLINETEVSDIISPNGPFESHQFLSTQYSDGTNFPEGYSYKVTLVQALGVADDSIISSENDFSDYTIEDKVESAIFKLLKKDYGDKLDSAKIYVDKTYTAEEAKEIPGVQDMNLGENDVAFEATINIQPAEGADPNEFTIPNGEFDAESGWVKDIKRIGVLKQNENGEYEITDFGTGW